VQRETVGELVRNEGSDDPQRERRDGQAKERADDRGRRRVEQRLEHEAPAARADRCTNRKLARPGDAARQQQIRYIEADDQEHQRRNSEEQGQRAIRAEHGHAGPACTGLNHDLPLSELFHEVGRHVGDGRGLDLVEDAAIERVDPGRCLLERDAGREARE
jgi:hypothetical protein